MEISVDNPILRHESAIMDKAGDGKQIITSPCALKHAREMPVSDDSGVITPSLPRYIFSQPAIPRASNWIQVGPTAIPRGQTISTYYRPLKYNIPALIAGRLTSIVLDRTDSNIIYVGSAQGGIWKTIDGGRNWFATSDYAPSLSIGALVVDPKNCKVPCAVQVKVTSSEKKLPSVVSILRVLWLWNTQNHGWRQEMDASWRRR